ncbi:MAG: 3,4-dihydroxy-2-butanone-4-phosphate synthase [Candidatus Peribacteraceae bacterium]|nr:3,4-dihydroxy-2-butanone-4-phosphate synthase [Candidatus Peribacteraceae bacterium]
MSAKRSSPIANALSQLRAGKFLIVVDDESRENEGDLVLAAEHVTAGKMAFAIRYTGGVVCLALSNALANQLDLPPMVARNTSKLSTAFTVSIDAKHGIETGISAADRAATVLAAVHPKAVAHDLVRPGHIFPLRAHQGGVLWRAGHTEASVDLCRLAGLREAAVISELMHEDGTMMRLPAIQSFAREHRIPVVSIQEIIEERRRTDSLIHLEAKSELETRYGTFEILIYTDLLENKEHVALRMGKINATTPVLVRVHSECITGDVFGSCHCDCGEQLAIALKLIAKEGCGVVLYLRQEGRGIGLSNKIRAYALQHMGLDTVDANRALGLGDDLREYGIGAQILKDLGLGKIRLLTNNPKKIVALRGYGLTVTEQIQIEITPKSERQKKYLQTKKTRMRHRLRKV